MKTSQKKHLNSIFQISYVIFLLLSSVNWPMAKLKTKKTTTSKVQNLKPIKVGCRVVCEQVNICFWMTGIYSIGPPYVDWQLQLAV